MARQDNQVLEVFRALPEHRGCSISELNATETTLGVRFPQRYREMMELDSGRLCGAGIVVPLLRLGELRQDASGLLAEDGHEFRLEPDDFVFAWEDIFAFYFFKADGSDDPAVMMFNYYDSSHSWQPIIAFDSLTLYFTDALRRYLGLG